MSLKATVAAAHLAPVYLDKVGTTRKVIEHMREAATRGVDLIVFPESFLPGFPIWPALSAPIHNHEFFRRFAQASVLVPGPEIHQICTTAREVGIHVSIGISEATLASVGCLWNSNLLIGSDGSILNHHRKLVPTFFEKLVWANGDGAGLRVCPTPFGRVGSLICGENTNPLARYALMAQGEQIHTSSYPPIWPTHVPSAADRYDLAAAIRIRAGAHCFEAKVFNVVAAARIDHTVDDTLQQLGAEAMDIVSATPRGVSMILGPDGGVIMQTSTDEDQLLIAKIDLADCVVPKQYHDVVGYYNRFDVFGLTVDRRAQAPATFLDNDSGARLLDFESIERLMAPAATRQPR